MKQHYWIESLLVRRDRSTYDCLLVQTEKTDALKITCKFEICEKTGTNVTTKWSNDGKVSLKRPRSQMVKTTEKLERPPHQHSVSHISNKLTDNELEKIFEYVHFEDLLQIANTCKQFKKVAQLTMFRHHKVKFNSYFSGLTPLWEIEAVLTDFSKSLTSVELNEQLFEDGIRVAFIEKHCKHLERLSCKMSHDFTRAWWDVIGRLFNSNEQLTQLGFISEYQSRVAFKWAGPLDIHRDSVVREDWLASGGHPIPGIHLPMLQTIILRCMVISPVFLVAFFRSCPQIRHLTICECDMLQHEADLYSSLSSLESLHLEQFVETEKILLSLSDRNIPLQKLILHHTKYAIPLEVIEKLETLKYLKMDLIGERFDVVNELIPCLQHLKSLETLVYSAAGITLADIKLILKSVKHLSYESFNFSLSEVVMFRSEHRILLQ